MSEGAGEKSRGRPPRSTKEVASRVEGSIAPTFSRSGEGAATRVAAVGDARRVASETAASGIVRQVLQGTLGPPCEMEMGAGRVFLLCPCRGKRRKDEGGGGVFVSTGWLTPSAFAAPVATARRPGGTLGGKKSGERVAEPAALIEWSKRVRVAHALQSNRWAGMLHRPPRADITLRSEPDAAIRLQKGAATRCLLV